MSDCKVGIPVKDRNRWKILRRLRDDLEVAPLSPHVQRAPLRL